MKNECKSVMSMALKSFRMTHDKFEKEINDWVTWKKAH